MKRVIAVILVLCMALSLCACSSSGSGSASGEKVIKIGVFEPSSGDSASGGKKEILGMQYANSQEPTVTLGGETYKVELVYGDNGSSTDKAPSAASSLVSAGVSVVLGSYGSGVSMAGGPKFEEAGIPAIGITCTNPNVTAGNSYYFRICFLDNFQADVLANFAVSKFSAKTAYCLGESGNEYDQGLIAFFTKVFEAAGGKVITDSFPTGNSDFGSYLNKAKSEGADVIFTPVFLASDHLVRAFFFRFVLRLMRQLDFCNRNLISDSFLYLLANAFLIDSALHSAPDMDIGTHLQICDISGISAPCNAGNIIRFIIGAVDRYQNIGYFSSKRRFTVNRGLTDKTIQINLIDILSLFLLRQGNLPREDGQHQTIFFTVVVIVAP